MTRVGQFLILVGVLIAVVGLMVMASDRLAFLSWLGRLPGDLRIESERTRFYFPITTCLVVSAVVTIVLTIVRHVMRRF